MPNTLCFIPCSKRKTVYPDSRSVPPTLTKSHIPATWQDLQSARQRMSDCIEERVRPRTALHLYDGGLYNSEVDFREDLARHLQAGRLELYILSAGYGLVHALDPICPYEAEMKGRVAMLWKDAGLVEVISELIHVSRAQRVFGFFAGPRYWSGAHAKYRYFFTEGVRAAIGSGVLVDTVTCFYRESGRGANAINGALGRTLLRGLRANFSPRFLDEHAMGRVDGNVMIRSENVHEAL